MKRPARAARLLGFWLALSLAPQALAAPQAIAAAAAPDFAKQALAVDVGGQLTVNGLQLEGEAAPSTLLLKRFTVSTCRASRRRQPHAGVCNRSAPAHRAHRPAAGVGQGCPRGGAGGG